MSRTKRARFTPEVATMKRASKPRQYKVVAERMFEEGYFFKDEDHASDLYYAAVQDFKQRYSNIKTGDFSDIVLVSYCARTSDGGCSDNGYDEYEDYYNYLCYKNRVTEAQLDEVEDIIHGIEDSLTDVTIDKIRKALGLVREDLAPYYAGKIAANVGEDYYFTAEDIFEGSSYDFGHKGKAYFLNYYCSDVFEATYYIREYKWNNSAWDFFNSELTQPNLGTVVNT